MQHQIACTFVYGQHSIPNRRPLWQNIQSLGVTHLPWICTDDFNSILALDDRLNGNPVSDAEVKDFTDCLEAMGLVEIKSKGSFYSWSNMSRGTDKTASRIDRGVVDEAWLQSHGQVEAIY